MSGFGLVDSIKVLTQTGECEIQLCLGDITKLKLKDKVDVIMVSAFAGDYTPTATSLIGALQRNLDLRVRLLALDKEEDLRQLYSCWWSKTLPENAPYKKLLCFETKIMSQSLPQEMVGDAFRCLVPVLNNEDGSVITPLLNTGNQGYSKDMMLKGMVEAAVRWMKAGLPLRMLKIVLYCPRVEGDSRKVAHKNGYKSTLVKFGQLKEKYDMQYMLPKEVPVEFDFYLSYSETDMGIVNTIVEKLKKHKADVRIFRKKQKLDKDAFWQEDMYEIMMKSSRVITVLSPNYMQSTACIEQYNIALCCNRKAHRDMLAPFYVITISNMPTYMGLVQYIDCRSKSTESIHEACNQIVVSLSINFTRGLSILNASVIRYDLFLSYSHKDTKLAQTMVKMLQELNPNLKIFFDVQELKTGKSWQRALYHSIDGSKCLVALMTNNYIKSAVCQEEFNLAMLKHYSKTNHLQLIPFVIEKMDSLPPSYERVPQITTDADHFEEDAGKLCSSLVQWLESGKLEDDSQSLVFQDNQDTKMNITEEWERVRRTRFEEDFQGSSTTFPPTMTKAFKKTKSSKDIDIVLSYNQHDEKYANFMISLLRHFAPDLNVVAKGTNDQERLTRIEEGKKIVPLLSPNYIESPEQVEELHVAIWRARTSTKLIFPVKLHILPANPAYFHLLPSEVDLHDHLWSELALKQKVALPAGVRKVISDMLKLSEELALYAAVYYLLENIERERAENLQPSTSPKPALLNMFHLDGTNSQGVESRADVNLQNTNNSNSSNPQLSEIGATCLDEVMGPTDVNREEVKGRVVENCGSVVNGQDEVKNQEEIHDQDNKGECHEKVEAEIDEVRGQDEVRSQDEFKDQDEGRDQDEIRGQDDNCQDEGKGQEKVNDLVDEVIGQDKVTSEAKNDSSVNTDIVNCSKQTTMEGEVNKPTQKEQKSRKGSKTCQVL